MNKPGWIYLHRMFLDWEWYDNVNTKVLFIHLLLKANYKDRKWKGITIKRGSLITSLEHLSKETGLSVMQVRTVIDRLKSTNEITYLGTPNYSKITIKNYNRYQTDNRLGNKRITTTKESNKVIKNTYAHSFKTFWKQYPRKESKKRAETIYKRKATSKKKETKILEGLKRFNVKWKAEETEKRYIPIPTSWLNAERWEDEIEISNVNKRPKL